MASFSRMASITASTKRSPGMVSGLEGAYVTNISSLACLPLDPVSPELELGVAGLAWRETLQTMVEGGLDIVEGDLLTVSGVDYPVRAVANWTWGPDSTDFLVLYLEDIK